MTGARAIPGDFDPAVVDAIDERLAAIRVDHDVAIPLAIESGSRAWGFASPDSDYDCRFVFVRRLDAYVTPWPPRDVIETPLDAVLDVNGWDVGKLIALIAKGNAVGIEWLRSPIVYCVDPDFRDALLDFAERQADRATVRRHYRELAGKQWRALRDHDDVKLKKLFYVLRPLAALRWLDRHPVRVPPMTLSELIDGADLSNAILAEIEALRAAKATAPEHWRGPVPIALRQFIEQQLDDDHDPVSPSRAIPRHGVRCDAESLFRTLVHRYGPATG